MAEQQPLSDGNGGSDLENVITTDDESDAGKLLDADKQQAKHKQSFEVNAALYEIVGALLIPMLLAPLASRSNLYMSNIVGIAFLTVYAWWAALIIWLFIKAYLNHSIYRIYTETAVPSNWIPMNIAFTNKAYPTQPVCSISEFSAIAGGIAKMSLARLGCYGWAMVVTYLGFQLHFKNDYLPAGLWAEVVGTFGIFVIGIFYYDPFSLKLRIGHFIGIFLSFGSFVGLFQQRIQAGSHIWLPCVFVAGFFIFYIIFWFTGGKESDDPKVVTFRSFRSIMLEFAALTCIALCVGVWFILVDFE